MKRRLLLSLCVVGAVFSGHTPNLLQTQTPSVSAERPVTARASARLPDHLMLKSTPEARPWFEHVTPSTSVQPGNGQSAPLPTTSEGTETTAPSPPEEVNWVVVIRGATVHSGPSVSAPIVRFYSVGTELELIDHQHGWFQVLDPVTSQRGWIYEKYYLQAIRGPGQGIAVLQEPPKQKLVNARNSTPHVRRAKNSGPRPSKKTRPVIASAPRYRYETVASILDRALRP